MVGYFAFPPPGYPPNPPRAPWSTPPNTHDDPRPELPPSPPPETAHDRVRELRQQRDAERRRRRLEDQRLEAQSGEIYWVRMGGSIRDMYGRKNKARTDELRTLSQIPDEERRAVEWWTEYETRWRILLSSAYPVAFQDVPWPVTPWARMPSDLTPEAIEEFFLAPLRASSNTVSRKARVRACILRWHPDKLSAVIARTEEKHLDDVRSGINAVFRVLKSIKDLDH
ncbi:hypothetical protein L226DRAFT_530814 [Lentinus tigrinus ALCF2SS1-7]|uniref:J domain-containing protein n=1 Tax=Lentinus tigrinus ALCF2SS1-6 TaxID=1328759 RepID=A0A5C2SP91_9APHY|nr:hypothetical protein L227DRAFT_649682 [Lentinus tigrinus ALCF2SS1-6]RPD78949.1 hypothetical protein L226DRAFT_530814 [Lentinus tigrinus ALCF2SS1-7]